MPAQIILKSLNGDGTIASSERMHPMFTLWEGHAHLLSESNDSSELCSPVKRREPCVRSNWFLAIGSRSIWNTAVHGIQKDCFGRRKMKTTGRERSHAL